MSIEIINSFFASVQDFGRKGYRSLGVPVAGAMDQLSAAYANTLVGNRSDEALIEVIGGSFSFKILKESLIAVTGADADLIVNDTKARTWRALFVNEGSVIEIRLKQRGLVNYISFAGGIDVPSLMQSKSTYYRGGFGGFRGRLLKNGDVLPLKTTDVHSVLDEVAGKRPTKDVLERIPDRDEILNLRATKGIHADLFSEDFNRIFQFIYTVGSSCDRMGYRLEGQCIEKARTLGRVITTAVDRGYVQLPPDGKPIVLMADSQTTGGYAVILHVIREDVDRLAQCSTGHKVRFSLVDTMTAEQFTALYSSILRNPPLQEPEEEYYGELPW